MSENQNQDQPQSPPEQSEDKFHEEFEGNILMGVHIFLMKDGTYVLQPTHQDMSAGAMEMLVKRAVDNIKRQMDAETIIRTQERMKKNSGIVTLDQH